MSAIGARLGSKRGARIGAGVSPKSRVVLLGELRVLFERRMIPMRIPMRIPVRFPAQANHIATRMTSGVAAPAMNRLPRTLPVPMPAQANAMAGAMPLGVAAAAPIWAWTGSGSSGATRAPSGVSTLTRAPERFSASRSVRIEATPDVDACHERAEAANSATVTDASERSREVRIPTEVLRAMAAMAARTGRRESELWAEAAREWLGRQAPSDDPPPATAALAPTAAIRASRDRCWGAIDILLGDLRAPERAPVPDAGRVPGQWDGSAA